MRPLAPWQGIHLLFFTCYAVHFYLLPTFSQRHVESLQTTAKRLEAELLAGQRREEGLHATAKILREKVAASKLEAWRSKVGEWTWCTACSRLAKRFK